MAHCHGCICHHLPAFHTLFLLHLYRRRRFPIPFSRCLIPFIGSPPGATCCEEGVSPWKTEKDPFLPGGACVHNHACKFPRFHIPPRQATVISGQLIRYFTIRIMLRVCRPLRSPPFPFPTYLKTQFLIQSLALSLPSTKSDSIGGIRKRGRPGSIL